MWTYEDKGKDRGRVNQTNYKLLPLSAVMKASFNSSVEDGLGASADDQHHASHADQVGGLVVVKNTYQKTNQYRWEAHQA